MTVTVFFDIDATLVHNHFSPKVFRPLAEAIATQAGISIDEVRQAVAQENKHRETTDPDNVLTMDWDDMLKTVAKRYGVVLDEGIDERWARLAHADDVEVYDDAHSMLDRLKQAGYRLVIATKGLSKYQDAVLQVTGLYPLFDDILTPDKTGYLKTTPAYFNRYTQAAQAGDVFVQVGDHHFDDVVCAKRNGFYSIMRAPIAELAEIPALERPRLLMSYHAQIPTYAPQYAHILPDAVVLSLQEVPQIIQTLLER